MIKIQCKQETIVHIYVTHSHLIYYYYFKIIQNLSVDCVPQTDSSIDLHSYGCNTTIQQFSNEIPVYM